MELFTPEFGLVFWMFVAFLCLYFILAKYAWPYIIKTMEERAELIDKGVAYAQEAKTQLDNAKSEADHLIAEARQQQVVVVDPRHQEQCHHGSAKVVSGGRFFKIIAKGP